MNRRAAMIVTVGLAAALTGCGSGGGVVPIASRGSTARTSGGQAAATAPTAAPATSQAVVPAATAPDVSVPAASAKALAASSTAPSAPLPFTTPDAAMRYLASAFNRRDDADLRRVTTPSARQALQEMHGEAVNLRLERCTRQPAGDYQCTFTHDYPRALKKPATAHGAATFTVGPADKPGWYMTVLESCG